MMVLIGFAAASLEKKLAEYVIAVDCGDILQDQPNLLVVCS